MTHEILQGDCLEVLRTLPENSVHCVVTSPPYWGLRDYGVEGQLGLESTPEAYVERMVAVFREVRRVLREDGTCWLNLGDSYASDTKGSGGPDSSSTLGGTKAENNGQRMALVKLRHGLKPKDLVGIPWRVAFALQADGWWLRQDIIWHKPNPMPESVTDRCTKAHEYVFLLTKSARYYYDSLAVSEPSVTPGGNRAERTDTTQLLGRNGDDSRKRTGNPTGIFRNRRSVWTITTKPYSGAHFATMPPDLAELCVLAGCPVGGTVLDPFAGSGTTLAVAKNNGRNGIGIELNPEYIELALDRLNGTQPALLAVFS